MLDCWEAEDDDDDGEGLERKDLALYMRRPDLENDDVHLKQFGLYEKGAFSKPLSGYAVIRRRERDSQASHPRMRWHSLRSIGPWLP